MSVVSVFIVYLMHVAVYASNGCGYYVANPTRLIIFIHNRGGRKSYLRQPVIDRLSPQSSQAKDGRATDSCFALIGAHQCTIHILH